MWKRVLLTDQRPPVIHESQQAPQPRLLASHSIIVLGAKGVMDTPLYKRMLSIIHWRSKQTCRVKERCESYDAPVDSNADLRNSNER